MKIIPSLVSVDRDTKQWEQKIGLIIGNGVQVQYNQSQSFHCTFLCADEQR